MSDIVRFGGIMLQIGLKTPISYYGGEAAAEFGNSQYVAAS